MKWCNSPYIGGYIGEKVPFEEEIKRGDHLENNILFFKVKTKSGDLFLWRVVLLPPIRYKGELNASIEGHMINERKSNSNI